MALGDWDLSWPASPAERGCDPNTRRRSPMVARGRVRVAESESESESESDCLVARSLGESV